MQLTSQTHPKFVMTWEDEEHTYTMTGTMESPYAAPWPDDDEIYPKYPLVVFPDKRRYALTFLQEEDIAYTIVKRKKVKYEVYKTAETAADNRTMKTLEEVRKRVGAPVDAEVNVRRNLSDEEAEYTVTFEWAE